MLIDSYASNFGDAGFWVYREGLSRMILLRIASDYILITVKISLEINNKKSKL